MVEATVNTTVSTADIWAIVIVASLALAFWLIMIFLADRSQVRASGPGPSARTAWVAGSVPQGEMPTRDDLPAQPYAMPRQQAGEGDRAFRSYAGPDRPDEENPRAGEAQPDR